MSLSNHRPFPLFLFRNRLDVDVALREGDVDPFLVEGVVDGLFRAGGEGVMRLHGGVEGNDEVHGAVAEGVEADVHGEGRVHDVAPVFVLGHERLQRFQDDLAGVGHVRSVANGDGHLDELVVLARVQVPELLGEQVRVREGDEGAVLVQDLGGLVAHALDDAADAVAGDLVADADAAGHELDAVEEVVDEVLEGEADAGGETGGDVGERGRRDVQDGENGDDEQEPAQQGDQGVREAQVHVGLLERVRRRFLPFLQDLAEFDHPVHGLEQID